MPNCGNNIIKDKCQWKFDRSVAEVFDEHVRKSIPRYDEFHEMVTGLCQWFVFDGCEVFDLGSSTGTFVDEMISRYSSKHVKFHCIDNSPAMIEKSKEKLSGYVKDGHRITHECLNLEDYKFKSGAGIIVSLFTLQFVNPGSRREIYRKVYESLREGGVFIVADKFYMGNGDVNDIFSDLHYDFKRTEGYSEEEIMAKRDSLRGIQKPDRLEVTIKSLQEAGFRETATFYQYLNFVGILAIK